jgi:DNA-binding CsgD family transcriptional regulator
MLGLRLERIAERESDPEALEAETISTMGIISFRRGDIRRAFRQSLEAAERLERIGRKRSAARSRSNAAFCAADLGDFGFVHRLSEEFRRDGLEPGEPLIAARIRVARATGGDAAGYLQLFERSRTSSTEYLRYMLARDLPWMISHDRQAARAIVRSALDATPAGDYGGELADAVVEFGDDEDIERALRHFADVEIAPDDVKSIAEKLLVDARLAARRNQSIEAVRNAAALADITRASGQWLLLAHALYILGKHDEMRTVLLRVGAVAELERLERRASSPSPKAVIVRLTSREEQVARLVVAGLSSREVAERLKIASRTVETHLANAYEKLQISSRSELAAYLASYSA